MPRDTFTVRILTPAAVTWSGEVTALEGENTDGIFSILPDHARFLTVLTETPITCFLPDETTRSFTYPAAVLAAAENTVTIYADVANAAASQAV